MAFATSLSRVNRLVSMISDQVTMTIIMMIWWVPVFVIRMNEFERSGEDARYLFMGQSLYGALIFSFYLNKDIYLGQSIGKRLLRFRVVNKKTGAPAGPLRCLVRNLTLLFWPLEVILAMINVHERLGDYIAGTMLVNYERETGVKPDWVMMGAALLLGFVFVYVVVVEPMFWLIRLVARFPFAY